MIFKKVKGCNTAKSTRNKVHFHTSTWTHKVHFTHKNDSFEATESSLMTSLPSLLISLPFTD
eukprot:m.153872 g.153872  ORF g.153872 m.153872 type:complete len:62 (-) comp13313_c1_seq4:2241-2426(-)